MDEDDLDLIEFGDDDEDENGLDELISEEDDYELFEGQAADHGQNEEIFFSYPVINKIEQYVAKGYLDI